MAQSRRMLVLRAVVEDYIRSQEPVGSTTLTRDHDLGVSSATVRNDMAALEDEGYLIQPHTSAGRVPTEKGYRYFVDRLATVVPLSEAQRRGINSFLSGSVSLKDALQRSARLLSEITGQVAVVASPSLAKATLRHVEMVPVAMTTLLAVVITDTGRVAQHGLTIASMPAVDETNRLSNTVWIGRQVLQKLTSPFSFREVSLQNGTIQDCRGCSYTACLHFAQRHTCFYGGAISTEIIPAIENCDAMLFLCPNYNDAVSANIMALFNRLTNLLTQRDLYDKYLFGIVVSGYSGSDLVAQQLMGAMCFNKTTMLPPCFCLMQTAHDPDSAKNMPDIQERIQAFPANMESVLLGRGVKKTY